MNTIIVKSSTPIHKERPVHLRWRAALSFLASACKNAVHSKAWAVCLLCATALLTCSAEIAFASELAESQCEEHADDLKRLAYWVIIGSVLTIPIWIGTIILPIGGFLWLGAELWWALC